MKFFLLMKNWIFSSNFGSLPSNFDSEKKISFYFLYLLLPIWVFKIFHCYYNCGLLAFFFLGVWTNSVSYGKGSINLTDIYIANWASPYLSLFRSRTVDIGCPEAFLSFDFLAQRPISNSHWPIISYGAYVSRSL